MDSHLETGAFLMTVITVRSSFRIRTPELSETSTTTCKIYYILINKTVINGMPFSGVSAREISVSRLMEKVRLTRTGLF